MLYGQNIWSNMLFFKIFDSLGIIDLDSLGLPYSSVPGALVRRRCRFKTGAPHGIPNRWVRIAFGHGFIEVLRSLDSRIFWFMSSFLFILYTLYTMNDWLMISLWLNFCHINRHVLDAFGCWNPRFFVVRPPCPHRRFK